MGKVRGGMERVPVVSRSLLLIWARNGAGTFEPVLAVITVIRGRGGNGFFDIWAQELQVISSVAPRVSSSICSPCHIDNRDNWDRVLWSEYNMDCRSRACKVSSS